MRRKKKLNKENRLKSTDTKCSEKSKQDKHKITSKCISSKLLKYLSKQKKSKTVRMQPWGGSGGIGKRDILTNTTDKSNGNFKNLVIFHGKNREKYIYSPFQNIPVPYIQISTERQINGKKVKNR